jgi:hypothetical protein
MSEIKEKTRIATRSECLTFISKVRHKAEEHVRTQFNEKITNLKSQLLQKYGMLNEMLQIQNMVDELSKAFVGLSKIASENSTSIEYGGYLSLESSLDDFTTKDGKSRCFENLLLRISTFKDNSMEARKIEELKKERDLKLEDVTREYRMLYSKAEKFKSPNKLIDYLTEIGFDTSSLRDIIVGEITLDKSKLFVCGETK